MAEIELNKLDKGDDFIDSLKEYVGNVSYQTHVIFWKSRFYLLG